MVNRPGDSVRPVCDPEAMKLARPVSLILALVVAALVAAVTVDAAHAVQSMREIVHIQ
jgi:hypothetical protein